MGKMAKEKKEKGGRIVLVGTYKGDQLTKWRGWYNYPVESGEECKVESGKCRVGGGEDLKNSTLSTLNFQLVNELWLFNGTKDERRYKAEFVGVKTREELIRDYGYLAWERDDLAAKNAKDGRVRSPSAPPKPGTTAIDAGAIFREALKAGSEEIIVAHNHPSGDLTPSKADIAATTELKDLASRLGVALLDHIIMGSSSSADGGEFVSLAESGKLDCICMKSKSVNIKGRGKR